jgi:hypothetical protein
MLILRDTSTSECYIVDFQESELDLERIEEAGLELAGPVRNHMAYKFVDVENEDEPGEDHPDQLYFTTCERDDCGKWILIIDDGAPTYCTEHEESE